MERILNVEFLMENKNKLLLDQIKRNYKKIWTPSAKLWQK